MLASLLALLYLLPSLGAAPARLEVSFALGEAGAVHLIGRALAGHSPPDHAPGDGTAVNLLRTLLAAASDELEGVRVEAQPVDPSDGPAAETRTDGEGFFRLTLALRPDGKDAPGTVPLRVRLDDPAHHAPEVLLDAAVLDPAGARVLVSDFDDTLAASGVHRPLRFLADLALESGADQPAVEGAPACIRTLAAACGALVILSASPVNLLPRLQAFLSTHRFPPAAFLLRDLGVGPEADPLDPAAYKSERLEALAAALPHARFVLLGDAVERDADVYADFRSAHPDRVERIWIHDPGTRAPWAGNLPPDAERFARYPDLGGGCTDRLDPLAPP